MHRPALVAGRTRPQRQRIAGAQLRICARQVLQQHPPGHAVHHQVVGGQQQALALGHVRQHQAQQRAVFQIEAALRLFAQGQQLCIVRHLAHPQAVRRQNRAIELFPTAIRQGTEAEVEALVVIQHGIQRPRQQRRFQRLAHVQQQRLVPVRAIAHRQLEEVRLDRRQRQRSARHILDLHGRAGIVLHQAQRQLLQARMTEDIARREFPARLAQATDHRQ
ncbi:hypothetical protein D3C78_1099440 [compost metagenome]